MEALESPTFPDYPPTVPGLLKAGRERHGDRCCVITPAERLTYADLDTRSRALAARLLTAGVGKSSRVGILFPNGPAWVVAWAAAARIGAVTIPVNTFYQTPELGRFLRHADVQFVLGVGSFIQHDYLSRLEGISPALARSGPGPHHLPDLPHLRRVLLWGPSDRPWATGDIGADLDQPLPAEMAGLGPVVDGMGEEVHAGDELLVTYTSGSTGEPKGVVHSHGAAIRHARNLAALSAIDCSSRIWTPMPLCWVGGFEFSLLRAATVGGCLLTQGVFEPGAALRLMYEEQVTNVSAWPGITKALVEHPDFEPARFSHLRGAASLYDAMPADRRPPERGLNVSSLGMSETCGPHTFWVAEEEVKGVPESHRGAFGHGVPGVQHRIVDPDTGTDMPPGEEGEVLVRGYSLMLGLYKRERSEVFDADGWYHTGDRGYFRDGSFFFTGRQTDLIKTKGSNVSPSEVEACLLAADGVKLAFVLGVPDPERGQDVTALVVPWRHADTGRPADLDPERLRSRLKEQLSSYKVPRRVFVIAEEDVPWLASQKADRRALAILAEKLTAR